MAEQRLHSALAPIDVLTRLEMETVLHKGMENFFHQEYLGVSYREFNDNANNVSQYAVDVSPDSGYAWSLKMVSAILSAAGSLAAFLGDNTLTAPIGGGATAVMGGLNVVNITFTSNVVVMSDQRAITLLASGNSQPVPSQPAVPASTVAVQNANTYPVNVTLTGFTATAVFVNGVQVGTTNGTYLVPAGGTISVTYSVAGTWIWVNANGLSTTPTISAIKILAKQVPAEMVGKL